MKKAAIISASVVGGLLILYLLFQFLVRGLDQTVLTYEAGYEASITKEDVLRGPSFLVGWSSLDDGGFDYKTIGEYQVTAKHGFLTYTYTAQVIDTLAPEIELRTDDIYVKVQDDIPLIDLLASAVDVGSDFSLTASCSAVPSTAGDSIAFSEVGDYDVTIFATDTYGNSASVDVSLYADTAPVFDGIQSYYVVEGTEIDYKFGITAMDDVDGDVTASITVDASGVELSQNGYYTAILSAVDQYGLTTEEQVEIYVESPEEIQDRINSHEIHRTTDHIVGAINLYDGGYFEDSDIDATLDYFGPAFVALTYDGTRSQSRGSGFIVAITDDEIIVASNSHVLSDSTNMDCEFFDGSIVQSTRIDINGQNPSDTDLGLTSVAIADLPEGLLDQLMTVHIDENYWDNLEDNSGLSIGLHVWGDSLGFLRDNDVTGELVARFTSDEATEYYNDGLMTQVTTRYYGGCSGSAIIDEHGNLIAIATMHTRCTNGDVHYMCVPLSNFLDYYESVMGEAANYL